MPFFFVVCALEHFFFLLHFTIIEFFRLSRECAHTFGNFSFRWKTERGFIAFFEVFSFKRFLDERSRTLIRAKNMCWWYIHNIPRTGAAPSTCSRKLDALRENLTVCQLLSLRTPCPPNKFYAMEKRRTVKILWIRKKLKKTRTKFSSTEIEIKAKEKN